MNGKGQAKGLDVSGHSGLDNPGKDILCAAVSVLAENLGGGIKNILGKNPSIEKSEGFYSVHLDEAQIDSKTELLFSTAILGLQNLSEQYPERLNIRSE